MNNLAYDELEARCKPIIEAEVLQREIAFADLVGEITSSAVAAGQPGGSRPALYFEKEYQKELASRCALVWNTIKEQNDLSRKFARNELADGAKSFFYDTVEKYRSHLAKDLKNRTRKVCKERKILEQRFEMMEYQHILLKQYASEIERWAYENEYQLMEKSREGRLKLSNLFLRVISWIVRFFTGK